MEQPNTKTQTAKGKAFARFTMLVEFKPQHQRANSDTGEVYERWTYRSDLENQKFKTLHGYSFVKEADVLAWIYWRNKEKFSRVTIYQNYKPECDQILYHEENGICLNNERAIAFKNWLLSVISSFNKRQ